MHPSLEQYLAALHAKRRAPATLKVVHQDLTHFMTWWEHKRGALSIQYCCAMKTSVTGECCASATMERLLPRSTADWPPSEATVVGRWQVICQFRIRWQT